jgi:hypothetical protein
MADGPDLNLATAWAANRLDIFAMGTDSALWHRWWG